MSRADSVRIDTVIHATEDVAGVIGAICHALNLDPDSFGVRRHEGHYGNPIATAGSTLRKGEATEFLENFLGSLGAEGVAELRDTIRSRISGSAIYLRLDKQDLIRGRLTVKDGGAVRIRVAVRAYQRKVEDALVELLRL